MRIKNLIVSLVFTLSFSFNLCAQRQKIDFTQNWKFFLGNISNNEAANKEYDDFTWEKVRLPHTWNINDAYDNLYGYYRGIGWYRKEVQFNNSYKNKRIFIRFDAAYQVAEVYVNGKHVGSHVGGYAAFSFDITDYLVFDSGKGESNVISVKVNSETSKDIPTITGDWTFFGGIYRAVNLIVCEPEHFALNDYSTSGVYVETPSVNEKEASVKIKTLLTNDTEKEKKVVFVHSIYDKNFNKTGEIKSEETLKPSSTQTFVSENKTILNPQLWSPETPHLYTVISQLLIDGKIVDEVINPLGFRWYSANVKTGFILNGKPIKLNGVCRMMDWKNRGWAISDEQDRIDVRLPKEMGANFMRFGHYTQSDLFLDELDKQGILAYEQISLSDIIGLSDKYAENASEMVKEMIRQHYNHPSIIIWGYFNELLLTYSKGGLSKEETLTLERKTLNLAKKLEATVKSEDKYRLTANSNHNNKPNYNRIGLNDISDITGWNVYNGWYGNVFEDFGKGEDKEHTLYPNRMVMITEYGAGSDTRVNSLKPEVYDFSNQYQQLFHESYLPQIHERKYIIGSAIWNMNDFASELRGESIPHINNKGVVTNDRRKKDIFYYYQANFDSKPMLYIATRDWAFRKGTANLHENFVKQPVKVYSNLSKVELFLNGKTLGVKFIKNFNAIFNVPFTDGANLLELVGISNGKKQKDTFSVQFKVEPYLLKDAKSIDLAINLGCNFQFYDTENQLVWEAEQPYREGSWGYLGGEIYRSNPNRIGTQANIIGTEIDPLYQTSREGISEFKLDVPNGIYDVYFVFNEPVMQKNDKILYDLSTVKDQTKNENERIFDIVINGKNFMSNLNLAKVYGINTAIDLKHQIVVLDGKGITISFIASKGKSIISALRVVGKK